MIRRFWISEDGNYAAIFSIAMIPMLTGVAGVVDFVNLSTDAAQLQDTLDATALAIATKYHSGMTQAEVRQFGSDFFGANIYSIGVSLDEDTDQPLAFQADAVADGGVINVSASAKITHQGFIAGPTTWQAKRASYVRFAPGQPACVLALDAHASDAVMIQGSTQVRLDGCVIASNSDAADSVSRGGSAQLAAKCVSTVGSTTGLSASDSDLDCGQPLEKQYPSLDPLAGTAPPAYGACKGLPGGKTKTLSPGTFCNKTWSGEITLGAGVYILRGGQIKLGGNGMLVGHGVTIFLMEGAEFTSNANEVIDLSPSASGPYAGITIFQEPGNTAALTINGTSNSRVSGFVYAPSAHVFYAGNSDMTGSGECIRIIGNTVEMTGNSAVSSNCDAELAGKKMNAGRQILLIK
jgi:Flp pilus assembly protein TadG